VSKYADAGVRLDTAEEAKRRIAELVRATRTPLARGAVGGFGGMVRVPEGYKKPVLVLSTDGVGSKVLVAAAAGVHDTVGEDLVNHSVNDILVHGATPLAFLSGKISSITRSTTFWCTAPRPSPFWTTSRPGISYRRSRRRSSAAWPGAVARTT